MVTNLNQLQIPQGLQAGDKVATVSLSWGGAGDEAILHRYEYGKQNLQQQFGLQVVEMTNTLKGSDYLYKNPQARVDDLHQAFADPSIKAVISCIGGNDAVRLIHKVDCNLLANNPKIFLGYSDSTVIHFMMLAAGVRSYYGPALLTGFAENTGMHNSVVQSFKANFLSNEPIGQLQPPPEGYTDEFINWCPENADKKRTLKPQTGWRYVQGAGQVQGRLIGGCTDVLLKLPGSQIWPQLSVFDDAVLFLENSEAQMSPDMFEDCLHAYGAQGVLQKLNAILLAKPCRIPQQQWAAYDDVLLKVAAEFDRPDLTMISQMDFGHTDPQMILPMGALVNIDHDRKTIVIPEPACRSR